MNRITQITRTLTLLGAIGLLAGCAASGVKRTASATQSMADLESYLGKAKTTIATTMTALDAVQKDAGVNPTKPFGKFTSGVANIQKMADSARERSTVMKARTKEQYDLWMEELAGIQSEDMKAMAEDRRKAAMKSFDAISQVAADVKEAYEPFINHLKDIQVYLANDLNPAGINSLSKQIAQAHKEAGAVQAELDKLIAEIAKVRAQMQAVQPKPEGK